MRECVTVSDIFGKGVDESLVRLPRGEAGTRHLDICTLHEDEIHILQLDIYLKSSS